MPLFRKKITVFQEKSRDRWLAAQAALKGAGLAGVRGGYFEETPVCGCGAKLDPRDFGPRGKIDRNTYYIRIYAEDEARARAILEEML
ncbi:MAG: hypothetical protein Q4F17_03360 [Eubacteriales bacterium]|nr:hypothetical protein [Eubacteriales bacterium]